MALRDVPRLQPDIQGAAAAWELGRRVQPLYRTWSAFAAHTTYWVLAMYVRPDGYFAPVNAFHPSDPDRGETAARGLIGLTAQFAATILGPRSVDVEPYREINQRYEREFLERGKAIRAAAEAAMTSAGE